MGLLRWLLGLFAAKGAGVDGPRSASPPHTARGRVRHRPRGKWTHPTLSKLRFPRTHPDDLVDQPPSSDLLPYLYAPPAIEWGIGGLIRRRKGTRKYLDLSQDVNPERLARFGLPILATPEDLANWLEMPLGQVAWLTGRFVKGGRPPSLKQAHYHFRWVAKRSGGARLLECPKPHLRAAQKKILLGILNRVPPHAAAHGFVSGRGIVSNAAPHVGRRVVVRWDLANFYATVRYGRIVAIFRSLGYSREVALWLARLTTSAIPADLPIPEAGAHALKPYQGRHLPQGACTSPALANLSAFALDVRLAGLATRFAGHYTRYADDLTISGGDEFAKNLRNVIPLVEQIVRTERFFLHPKKRRILRPGRRQSVTGVVVNEKINIARKDYDTLKAILHNARRHGAVSQNRAQHADFAAHLRGRIAHVAQLNPRRGEKLEAIYQKIDFS